MSENVQEFLTNYSFGRLEETARTFRRLGEAYEDTGENEEPGISRQLLLVADVLEECVTINLYSQKMDKKQVRELFRRCFLAGVRLKNISLIKAKNGTTELAFQARTVGKNCMSVKRLLPVFYEVLGYRYFEPGNGNETIGSEYGQYIFMRECRFRILNGVARRGKGTSRFNGDNFLISRLDCGKTTAAIADGMGSGRRAFAESRMVIELMENCIEAGFAEKAALELINSAYIAGGSRQSKKSDGKKAEKHMGANPVTIDMSVIDCQTGMLSCIKLGAAATFIKRESMVEIIKSTTLPIGVLENIDYDCISKKLYNGDYVIMISDGILENLGGIDKEKEMADIINKISVKKPNAMAEEIMRESLKYNGNRPSDDMTVLVLGLFDTYDK